MVVIENKLIDFRIEFVETITIGGTNRERILEPINQCIKEYKEELEEDIERDVIIVVDYEWERDGYILKMYAYLKDFSK